MKVQKIIKQLNYTCLTQFSIVFCSALKQQVSIFKLEKDKRRVKTWQFLFLQIDSFKIQFVKYQALCDYEKMIVSSILLQILLKYQNIRIMIHGTKKSKKEKSQQEKNDEENLSNKINSKLEDFFGINRSQISEQHLGKYFEFTTILMQLCSDIPTIFNFRRELIIKKVQSLEDEKTLAAIYQGDIKLTTKLIQCDPKSYTIWSYRQWLIKRLYPIQKSIIKTEKALIGMLLSKDEKNFHAWNYRNWINSIELEIDQELNFTNQKIKSNPFNFSPYHFRTKLIPQKFAQVLKSQISLQQKQQIIKYGMPKKFFDAQLENVRTAIFLNPNEQAPWIYYHWILGQIVPAFLIHKECKENKWILKFNMKVSDFSPLIESQEPFTLKGLQGGMNSEQWQLQGCKNFRIKPTSDGSIRLEMTGNSFFGQQISRQQIDEVKAIFQKEIDFVFEVLESEENKCRFAWLEIAGIYKFKMLCGTTEEEWNKATSQALKCIDNVKSEMKNKKYIDRQQKYWKQMRQGKLGQLESSLRGMF